MNAIHEFQSRGKEYKVAGTAEGGRFRLLARSPTSGFFETVAYSDQESIQADMLAELARLATQKAENLPDGSREFEHGGKRWKIGVEGQGAFIARETRDGWRMTNFEYSLTPPYYVIAREFAAFGREQGFAQKIDSLESATRERIAAIEAERDRARDDARDTFRDLNAARERIAELEAQLAAAGRARTEGEALTMCATFDPSVNGTYEPHARLYVRRGDSVFSLREGLDREGAEWIKLPPLPPIEPVKAGAEERKPAPPALARHDWHTHRGHVSCERCGAPFSESRKDQACGAQP